MSYIAEILQAEFDALKEDLIAKHDELGMRASGNWADSLEVVVTDTNAKIIGEQYSDQIEYGRKPGAMPPTEAIEKWIHDKGIASRIEGEISVSSLAYLIARKIAREGTEAFKKGGERVISEIVTPERIQMILDKVGSEYANTVTKDILTYLKQAA